MKIFILLFALLGAAAFPLRAQHWFQNNPHWDSFFSFGFAGSGYEYTSVQGDTVVQGLLATQLKRFRNLPSNDNTDIRVARQHGDTILLWNANTSQYHLAYNFSLAVGDSVAVPLYWGGGQFKYTLDSIGTLSIDGKTLRFQRIEFLHVNSDDANCRALIIETIGFVNGSCTTTDLQFPYGGHLFLDERNEGYVDGPEWVFCRFHNDLLDYSDPIALCDELTSQEEPVGTFSSFLIQPNPFHDAFSVSTNGDQLPLHLRIFDATGRLVRRVLPPFENLSAVALPPGYYFLEITSDAGKRQFCKAVKQ